MLKKHLLIIILLTLTLSNCSKKKEHVKKNDSSKQKIVKEIPEKINSFVFVGIINSKPGLYKYSIKNKSYNKFWSDRSEKIVDLSYNEDRRAAFFVTASNYGKEGAFPFVNNVKLYLFKNDSLSTVKQVDKIGSGLQIFTRWENSNTFKIIINSIDKIVATYVNQRTLIFNTFGRKLLDETQTFNLAREGYPKPPKEKTQINSPDNEYSIYSERDSIYKYYLVRNNLNEKDSIVNQTQKLNEVEWSKDEKYLVFSTLFLSPGNKTLYTKNPQTSGLFVYSIIQKNLLKGWMGGGFKNFFLTNNYLIFDTGFKNDSKIIIYNFRKNKILDTIKINEGCGIKNIPLIPDFSA